MSTTPVEQKFTATNPQPFDSLGLFTYLRTYARRINEADPNSPVETWHDCLSRVVNACNTQLGVGFTQDEKQEFFDLLYNLKCSVAGRFLWQLGTRTVDKLGLMSLQNCAFTVIDTPVKPFTWIMNFLMLGAGCGYRISKEDIAKFPIVQHAVITRRDDKDSDYIVPDSRQGWIKLLGKVLKAHFYSGEGFSYSCHLLRSKGAPIKGFGGLSSGPEVLCDGISKINDLLNVRAGGYITSVDALDIANIIGMIVVSGNVRRCLPKGALVHTDKGLVPIENVTVGTSVLTTQGYRNVKTTFVQGVQKLVNITTQDGEFKCTPNHKMAVWSTPSSYAWKEAALLKNTDCLITTKYSDTEHIDILCPVEVISVSDGGEEETFDIEVEDMHEFFCNGYLTHNSAQIALGDASDVEYMKAKRWDLGSIPNWRCYSNNSVICNDINEIIDNDDFWAGYNGNGEPYGLVNLRLSKSCGRLGDTSYTDPDVEGYNPCVTSDTWVMTKEGPRMVGDLIGKGKVRVYVDGQLYDTTEMGFFQTRVAPVYKLQTREGYSLRATDNHRIMTPSGWIPLGKLQVGDKVLIHKHHYISWDGTGTFTDGFDFGIDATENEEKHDENYYYTIEKSSSEFCRGFIKGVFANRGFVCESLKSILIFSNNSKLRDTIQRILNRFGIHTSTEQIKNTFLVVKQGETLKKLIEGMHIEYTPAEYLATVSSIVADGIEPVFDCTVPEVGKFDANSFVVSNCAEQSLARWETCCLGEIYLPNISSYEELKKCVSYIYRTCKHSLALPCLDSKETTEIVHNNFRMGIGVTGYLQATEEQRGWLKDCYLYLREYDRAYSLIKNLPTSVKLTTCKPSGTLSILGHCTSGVHPGFAQYYIRRIRVSSESKLIGIAKAHGYHIEYVQNFDGSLDYTTQVISFPYTLPEGTILAEDCSAVQQLEYVKRLQTEWSDNAVSVTVYYRKEELPAIKEWLRANYNDSVKTVSFLLHSEHGFKQAPLEKISKEEYLTMIKNTKPITDVSTICYIPVDDNFVGEGECAGGACPLK